MMVATHETGFAKEVADTVIFMDGGLVVEQGPPAELLGNHREPRTQKFQEKCWSDQGDTGRHRPDLGLAVTRQGVATPGALGPSPLGGDDLRHP